MKLKLLALSSLIGLVGCQSNQYSAPTQRTSVTWTEPTSGALPTLQNAELNTKLSVLKTKLIAYNTTGELLFDTSSFVTCNLSPVMAKKLQNLDREGESFKKHNMYFEFIASSIRATPSDCVRLNTEETENVNYYTYFEYFSDEKGGRSVTETYVKKLADASYTLSVSNFGSANYIPKMVTYLYTAGGNATSLMNSMFKDGVYSASETYAVSENEKITISYNGELLSSSTRTYHDQVDGYLTLYGQYESSTCYKAGEPVSDTSYCDNLPTNSKAEHILTKVKAGPVPRKIVKVHQVAPAQPRETNLSTSASSSGSSSSSSSGSSDFWALAGAAATVAFGVDEGLTTDSAASLGAGMYDLLSEGDNSRLNSATDSLEYESKQYNSTASAPIRTQQPLTTKPVATYGVKKQSTASYGRKVEYANNAEMAKLEGLIKQTRQQGGDTSSFEKLLADEKRKPRDPSARPVTLKPNLIDGYAFCRDPELDVQIDSHCQTAMVYYSRYLQHIGTPNEQETYEHHRKSAKIAKAVYDRTR